MVKKYLWRIENNIEHTCHDYETGEMIFLSPGVTLSLTIIDASAFTIKDKHFLHNQCEFLVYKTKEYTEFKALKAKKPNWIFKGTSTEFWEELNSRFNLKD